MKNLLILFALLCAFQTATAQVPDDLKTILRERVEVGRTNQSIVAAAIDEKGVQFVAYGKTAPTTAKNSDEDTVYEIGSVTKVFTGALLAEAVKRGEVSLADPISKYLPASVKSPTRGGREISLLDLATHTSGLPRLPSNFAPKDARNPYADYTVEQMYAFLSNYRLTNDIGAQYEYSNFGMALLGHILSLRARTDYENLVKKRILEPLQMRDTTITLSAAQAARAAQGFDENGDAVPLWDFPTVAGAGALRSTAKDMAKFVRANLGAEKTALADVLSEAQKPLRAAGATMKIGLGWHVREKANATVVWHNGGTGGFRSFVGFDPANKRGIVVLTNSAESVDDIGFHYLDAAMPLKKIKPPVAVSEKILAEYAGEYELAPNVVFTITRAGDRLFAQLTNQSRLRVFAESENKFYYKSVNAKLVFNRAAAGKDAGKIESLTLDQNGLQTARKIK